MGCRISPEVDSQLRLEKVYIFQTQDADLERDVPNLPAWSTHEYYLQVLLHTAVYLYIWYHNYIYNIYVIYIV